MKTGFKLTKNVGNTYDKIFKIIDNDSILFRKSTASEFEVEGGYVIFIDGLDGGTIEKILKLKGVEECEQKVCDYCGKQIESDKLKRGGHCYCAECYVFDNVD